MRILPKYTSTLPRCLRFLVLGILYGGNCEELFASSNGNDMCKENNIIVGEYKIYTTIYEVQDAIPHKRYTCDNSLTCSSDKNASVETCHLIPSCACFVPNQWNVVLYHRLTLC